MREYLKNYEITLTTKSPLFIGNGKEFGKKEYVFLSGNEIGIVDISKMYSVIQRKTLEKEFEQFILQNTKSSLDEWLDDNGILTDDIRDCMKYQVKYGKLSLEKGKRLQILEFMKDAYGKPYVPGSSLKGMLRTILLAADIMKNFSKYRNDKESLSKELREYSSNRKFPAQSMKKTEVKRFNLLERNEKKYNAVNDIMAGVIISDSQPLDVEDLVLCQRVERKPDGTEKRMNVLRECIKPGCSIRFQLTIDESLCNIKIQQIISAIRQFINMYNECFVCKFTGMDLLDDNMVCLGGGVGFLSKTVIYPMFGEKKGVRITQDIFKKTKVPREHKHEMDFDMGVSPHIIKCAEYNGQTMQMGICKMEIK